MPITGALRQTSEKLFTGVKVWRKAKKFGVGGKTVYEIDTQLMLRLCNSKPCKTLFNMMNNLLSLRNEKTKGFRIARGLGGWHGLMAT